MIWLGSALLFPICFTGLVYGGDPNSDLSSVIDYTYTDLPYPSSLAPWNHSHYGPDYHVFSNVHLSNQAILFYAEATHQGVLPKEVVLNTLETEIHLPVTRVPAEKDANCKGYMHRPAVLHAGTVWETNFWEFTFNNIMPLWATLVEQGLIDKDRYLTKDWAPSPEEAGFVMIQGRQEAFETPWSYWFDYLTPHQTLLQKMDGVCFSKLVVVSTSLLRFMSEHSFATEQAKWQHDYEVSQYMKAFKRWMFRMEDVHRRSKGVPPLPPLADSVAYQRPRVLYSSRPLKPGGSISRAVLNEAELVQFIGDRYDVNVTAVEFRGPLELAMHYVRSSDLMIGMHGAGLTHAIWLREGAHLLQLLPYGYIQSRESLPPIRGQYFGDAVMTFGATYSHWVNPHKHKALFHKEHFEDPNDFVEHPSDSLPHPVDWNPEKFWIYQSTEVDLESFTPALDHAMRKINVPRRIKAPTIGSI